jgi:two-component system, LytTR family, sensor kinase
LKTSCEGCGLTLSPESEAFICSYECTFCAECASRNRQICSHCGGELVRRPRRGNAPVNPPARSLEAPSTIRSPLVWLVSFGAWTFVSLAATATIFELYHKTSSSMSLLTVAGMEFSYAFTYAPVTPFAFAFAMRYPIQKSNWKRRIWMHLAAALLFAMGHIVIRSAAPMGYWDPNHHEWSSGIWDTHTHAFRPVWSSWKSMFWEDVVDDTTGAYVTIMLVALAVSYYRRFREREIRAAQLEGQLAKARLQSLKSQLQPHFLFNTMHSISALMLTDVHAADRMMSRLSDLLRISLENAGTQITTLNRELEFANCYLDIEKVRFEERLNVILDIAPETLDAQVPHLLLQPLVDNAVKHGISKLPGGGEIRITVKAQGDHLQFEVHDDGPGFGSVQPLSASGLGLRVTRERLESLYGRDQSLEMFTPPEGGATIRVRIPFRVQPEFENDEEMVATLRETG